MVPSKFKSRGQMSLNSNTTLLDWLVVLNTDRLHLYKCTGLRNFPQRSASVELSTSLLLPSNIQQLFRPSYLQSAYCKTFND